MSGVTYSLKSIQNDRFFEKVFIAIYLLSEFLPEICSEEVAEEIFFSYFRFDVWPGIKLQYSKSRPINAKCCLSPEAD